SESNALNAWEAGTSNLSLSNTLFFRLPNDGSVLLNADNKILVGRFTTCGNLCVKLGVQYFENYSGPGSAFQTEVLEGCFNNPCLSNPIAQNANVTQSGCTTESQFINLNAGGNVPVTYELWNTSLNAPLATTNSMDGSCSFNAPSAGSFVIHSTDTHGCRDTTNAISIQEFIPPSIQLNGHNLSCFEDASGSIDISGSGGTGVLVEVFSLSQLPFSISNLDAGVVNVQVVDENGCQASSSVLLEQPAALQASITQQTDLVCANQCTGAIEFSTNGGVGIYSFELLSNGFSGVASGTLTNLCGGADTLIVSDENSCVFQLPFELNYPDSIQIFSGGVGPTCPEYTDGEANLFFSGGTGALHITIGKGNYEILPQSVVEYQLA
ncbi:MAG: hypothetical protein ACEQSL_11545, partial [Sediminibacterium sp.]